MNNQMNMGVENQYFVNPFKRTPVNKVKRAVQRKSHCQIHLVLYAYISLKNLKKTSLSIWQYISNEAKSIFRTTSAAQH